MSRNEPTTSLPVNKKRRPVGFGLGNAASSRGGTTPKVGERIVTKPNPRYDPATEEDRIERERAAKERKRKRRLDELERTNYRDVGTNLTILPGEVGSSRATLAGILAAKRQGGTEGLDEVLSKAAVSTSTSNVASSSEVQTPQSSKTRRGGASLTNPTPKGSGSPSSGTTTNPNAGEGKRKQSAEVKRLLSSRKGFSSLLEDASGHPLFSSPPNYITASARPSRYPAKPICTICGYWGSITCGRCSEKYCGLKCGATHDETRCEKPLRR
ncbi:hypothetical protein IE53DRAFT_368669 [Violaceomyces palustris]|uniref:Uncharacterized protein n=1 Tax=Violaceomyces palustris TaxID=1673888 RepID=A0ACD0NY15_9BASI|nr:hypothetical protein IE53DRAFT_368669 [Violaceomyces palustris]